MLVIFFGARSVQIVAPALPDGFTVPVIKPAFLAATSSKSDSGGSSAVSSIFLKDDLLSYFLVLFLWIAS